MIQLSLFHTNLVDPVSDDPDILNIFEGLSNVIRYSQDIAHGYPIYSTNTTVDSLYRDVDPQLIIAEGPIKYGDLLNIYHIDGQVKARLATASDPEKYANSVALSAASQNQLVRCAVRSAYVQKIFPFNGPAFLSMSPGLLSPSIPPDGAIAQKIGDTDSAGKLWFYFHSPFLLAEDQLI